MIVEIFAADPSFCVGPCSRIRLPKTNKTTKIKEKENKQTSKKQKKKQKKETNPKKKTKKEDNKK